VEQSRAVYVISVAAELAGMHPQTLRIYERRGLIEPSRTPGGSRRYSPADIQRLQQIQELTNDGVSLMGVVHVLQLQDELARARAEIQRLHQEIEDVRREAQRAVDQVHRQYRRDLVPVSRPAVHLQRSAP
jgi:MerR family transcriptional regulator, heat shock protein HspR